MRLFCPLMLALIAPSAGAAQAGVIAGTVRDEAGAPIPNAQVFVVGTAFSTLTDKLGTYTLRGVPAGSHDLRAAFVGYRPLLKRDITTATDTTTVDWALQAGPMVITSCIWPAERPLVPRDHNTTRWIMSRELLANEPLR